MDMLASLRQIIQEVNSAKNLKTALDITVSRVRRAMNTEVCSVYMLDSNHERYTFMATRGLNKEFEGKASVAVDEGLVGLVGRREEPLNLKNAFAHPKFIHLDGLGEEAYSAFLGVPIIHQRRLLGVLVVQQVEERRFDESEEAFLVTLSAQLAAVIAHAEITGSLEGEEGTETHKSNTRFSGISGAPGIAIGEVVVLSPPADLKAVPYRHCHDVQAEVDFFNQALDSVRMDIWQLGEKLSSQLRPEERALFDVYLGMLNDNALGAEVVDRIRAGEWAQGALSHVVLEHVQTFELMEDAYLKERAVDVMDLGRRVLAYLQQTEQTVQEYPEQTILVGEELTASMLGEVPKDKLCGLVSVRGSSNSHVAIMARAMGIPTVMGAVDLPFTQLDEHELIIDGYTGHVLVNPTQDVRVHYEKICEEERLVIRGLEALKDVPCVTTDDHRIPLVVNTGLSSDVVRSLDHGAEGVGLYRTEVPFLMRERFPSEEEQRKIYREQLDAFAPNTVTMRTLDIGGDKALPYFPIEEDNPFLGWRGIRVTLDHPEIFLVQLRAMLKASVGLDNLRIMLPMISNVPELEEALELVYRCHDELLDEGLEIQLPPVGVMIEVPAAVYQARDLARRVDFLSVGSNDLTQYLLAVDRNNPRVAELYHQYHPAVIHALCRIAEDGHIEGKPVSICGELAGDPGAAILLTAMGFDSLSMNATNLPRVKSVLRQISMSQARALLSEVMALDNSREIHHAVENVLNELGVSRLFQASTF